VLAALVGEVGVFGEEAVAGMDGVGADFLGDLQIFSVTEIALFRRADRSNRPRRRIGRGGGAVDLRCNGDRLDPDFPAGPDDRRAISPRLAMRTFFMDAALVMNPVF
jgi:hypothetical protein